MGIYFLRAQIATLALFLTIFSATSTADASLAPAVRHKKRNWSAFTNRTELIPENPAALEKRDGSKYVFMHHIVGNTYPYSYADWLDDMVKIAAKGVDAIALNIGGSSWQRDQVALAYQAAQNSGTGIKLFYSFDLTEMPCDLGDLVARVNLYANHPSQFKVGGKPMISSYSGDCLGPSGWASLKQQTNGYLMPFVWGLENNFGSWPALDSWYCWGCAWPQGNYPKNTADDNFYIGQLGGKYATTISGWMYTHLNSKNFYLRGDDWLIVNRWEQLMQMRNTLSFVEIVTWNDWGEADYFGPFKGAQPSGTFYAEDFPHTAWFDLSQYYITAFKTGSYPAITQSKIYFWARPHPAAANALNDHLPKPSGWDWTEDSMWAAVYATSDAIVTISCGSSSTTVTVGAGVSKLKVPLAPGKMSVKMVRNGQTIIDYTPSDYTYVLQPAKYNYNAWVGSATATTEGSAGSTTTTTATATSTATPTPTGTWNYLGCYPDADSRTLSGLMSSDSAQTVSKCQAKCQASGYTYAGVEYGIECFCSNSLRSGVSSVAESECSMACAGNASQKCGASYRVGVYKIGAAPAPAPVTWSSYGCVAEGTTGTRRALTGPAFSQSNMTPSLCQSLCAGYKFAGTEYGQECYCGNTLTNNGATGNVIPASQCPSACGGDASQKCGGSWTMSVSTTGTVPTPPAPWTSVGCYVDASTRMLRGSVQTPSGLTGEMCATICASQGATIAGTQNGSQCFCGTSVFKEGGAGVPAPAASQCSVPCPGHPSSKCGAGWRMNVYVKPGTTI